MASCAATQTLEFPVSFGRKEAKDQLAEHRRSNLIGRGVPWRRAEGWVGQEAPTSEAPAGVWLACRSACPATSFLGLELGGWSPEEPRMDFQGQD